MVFKNPEEFLKQLPSSYSIISIDYGIKKMGIAVAHSDFAVASPLEIILRTNLTMDIQRIQCIINQYSANGIVIGLPCMEDGQEAKSASKVKRFARDIEKKLNIPITFYDESFSTQEANEVLQSQGLKRKKRNIIDDKIAAQIILKRFLEAYAGNNI